jgi:hypothetical protein
MMLGPKHTPFEQESKVAEDKAGEMMTIVAKEYADGKLETEELYLRRLELLKQAGICKRKFTIKQTFARSNDRTTQDINEVTTGARGATETAMGSAASSRQVPWKRLGKGHGKGGDTAYGKDCKQGRHEGGKGGDTDAEGVDDITEKGN